MKHLIKKTKNGNLRLMTHNGIPNLKRYPQFKMLFDENENHLIFAEPNNNRATKETLWYTSIEGTLKNYLDVDENYKQQIVAVLKKQTKELFNRALYIYEHDKDNKSILEVLEKSIEIPDLSDLNVVETTNNKIYVVLSRWSSIFDNYGAEKGIIKSLVPIKIKDVQIRVKYDNDKVAKNEKFLIRVGEKQFDSFTDENGNIDLVDIPFWTNIEIEYNDEVEKKWSFVCNSSDFFNIQIPPKITYHNVNVKFTDENGKPRKKEQVKFIINGKETTYTADSSGFISLPDLPIGEKFTAILEDGKKQEFTCDGRPVYELIKISKKIKKEEKVNKEPKLEKLKKEEPKIIEPPIIHTHKIDIDIKTSPKKIYVVNKKNKYIAKANVDIVEASKNYATNKKGYFVANLIEGQNYNFKAKSFWYKGKAEKNISKEESYRITVGFRKDLFFLLLFGFLLITTMVFVFKPKNYSNKVYFSGFLVSSQMTTDDVTTPFNKKCGEIFCSRELKDLEKDLPLANKFTFDAIVIGENLKFILYDKKNFEGNIIIEIEGPVIINNNRWQHDSSYNWVNDVNFEGEYKIFNSYEKVWSETNMNKWILGSAKIIKK